MLFVLVLMTMTTVALPKKSFGIDISQYNGNVNFKKLKALPSSTRPRYIIVRATMGHDGRDTKFRHNFAQAKKYGFVVGVYHYYRPDEDPAKQARNFIKVVRLKPGNIVPVLDIEAKPRKISNTQLRKNLKKFLSIIEKQYHCVPMIYSGHNYYDIYLDGYGFERYPSWIAAYGKKWSKKPLVKAASIHQYSETRQIIGKTFDVNYANLDVIRIKSKSVSKAKKHRK